MSDSDDLAGWHQLHKNCHKGKHMHYLSHHAGTAKIVRRLTSIVLGIAAFGVMTGCGKGDKIPTTAERLSSVQQKQETQPDFFVPRKTVDYMTDLKSIKDAPAKPEPPPARAEPAKSAELRAAAPEPRVAVTPPPAAAQPAPTPTPAIAVPASNVIASAAPTTRPVPKQETAAAITVISREQPAFPRDAQRAGVESGTVRARLTINAAGEVTNVAILQAQPARVFDRSVQQALGRWKFNAGAEGRTFDTEIGFKSAN